ncbi:hypothetical protein EW026_g2239 [Hermanssonia centrifuga]|uniref:BZIP domain-containing protein n=1 Tax=Hermanssonia centrifuga TaxID=98765 RepID=A0A4S4KNY5_9APHY|nr:hypothetical protein EW026_g2239 [Hermanssonia centrifuga]
MEFPDIRGAHLGTLPPDPPSEENAPAEVYQQTFGGYMLPARLYNSSSTTSHIDRPERSRNAKAQARHRAKRKAYIEQLEQTVTRLQYALSLAPDQMVAVPPAPQMRIRELEEENMHLTRQVEHLRHQLEARNARLRPDNGQRSATLPTFDDRMADRDVVRRRRTVEESDDLYMSQTCVHVSSSSHVTQHPYARGPSQYNNVKIEEDVYQSTEISQGIPQPTAYSTLSHTFGGSQSAVSHWHTYPEHA